MTKGMDMRQKMRPPFSDIQGGLFSRVDKADVGDAADAVLAAGGDMLAWADPFMPDDCMPDTIKDIAMERVMSGAAAHYTHPIGDLALKQAIARKLKRDNALDMDPRRNILVTPGSDSGLLFAMMPFIGAGDEVLVPDPSYPSNFLNPALLSGRAVSVMLDENDGFRLTRTALQKALTPRTKMLLITSPNNPTGTVFSRAEMEMAAEFVLKNDLVAVVDQAFEDFIYDKREMVTLASLPGMRERTVTVFSSSKGMALSGARIGYIAADDSVMDVLYGCAVNVIGAANSVFQPAVVWALDHPDFMAEYEELFDERRKRVFDLLSGITGVQPVMPQSGFLMWVDVSGLGTASEISAYLAREALVLVNSGDAYGKQGRGHIRIVFGCFKDARRVYAAMQRVREALIRYPKGGQPGMGQEGNPA